jgi:opacity protein-like surface antigen
MNKSLIGAFAALLLATGAHAADLATPEVVEAPPVYSPEVQVAEISGWYLRGDASFNYNVLRGANYFQGSNSNLRDFDTAKLGNSFGIGGGVGYQINSYLRTDFTADYGFRSTFTGSTSGTCGGGVPCTSSDVSHMTTLSLLANAYVDFGTYGSITPYAGAGIGGTYVNWDGLTNTDADGTFHHEGRSSWRFTWALMAGASVDLTCNLKADVGYRYRHVNGGDMFGYLLNGGPGYDKGFDIHEGRVGMRYQFGDTGCGQVAYTPPAPMPVYK